ncbi:MAG: hypothetical protein ACXIU7_06150 [Roseinatronobacter sp.]
MQTDSAERLQRRLRLGFVILVAALAIFVIWTASGFRTAARLFPVYTAWATLGFCALELARQGWHFWRRGRAQGGPVQQVGPETADIGVDAEDMGLEGFARGLAVFGWVAGFVGLIVLIGMPWATILFIPAILHIRFRSDWRATLAIVLGMLALMWALVSFLRLRLPPGLIELPFPL